MKKRKKYLLILISIGFVYFAYSFHSEKKKYEILSEIFEDTNFYPDRICDQESVISIDQTTNTLIKNFSWFDTPSVYSQVLMQNIRELLEIQRKLKPNKITFKNKSYNPEIISDCSTSSKKIEKENKIIIFTDSNYSVSFPILSSDNKTAMIEINNHCGILCGNGDIYVFKKVGNKWKIIEKVLKWIS